MIQLEIKDSHPWKPATKTKGLTAKHITALLVDCTARGMFLVDTLEGREPVGRDVMVCVGESGDVWQQTPSKLLKKYTIDSINELGWLVCTPRPENSVLCFEVTYDITLTESFYILGQWGEQTVDGFRQYGHVGDFICMNPDDRSDVWVVQRKIFLNTYTMKE
jgi:hypothetical protein